MRYATLGLFLLIIFAVPVFEVAHGEWPLKGVTLPVSGRARIDGRLAREIDGALDSRARLPKAIGPLYRELLYRVLGATADRVVAGRDGWLFLKESVVDYPPRPGVEHLPKTTAAVAALQKSLAKHGTLLIPLMVPNKETMAADKLAFRAFEPAFDLAFDSLKKAGVELDDLRPLLKKGDEVLYYPRDTHWTNPGALGVAQAVAAKLRAIYGEQSLPGKPIESDLRERLMPFEGGLVSMLGFREDSDLHRSLVDQRYVMVYTDRATHEELGSRLPQPLVVCGTSFAHGARFAAMLSASIGRPVENQAVEGMPATWSLIRVVADALLQRRPWPRVIVWEFPERYLFLDPLGFETPLDCLRIATDLGDHEEIPLISTKAVTSGFNPVATAGKEKELVFCQPYKSYTSITYTLDPPLEGDGSNLLIFSERVPILDYCAVLADDGSGFERLADVFVMGFDLEQLVAVPLKVRSGKPIRQVRIEPAQKVEPFSISKVRLWRKKP